ncbi:putative stearoyl-CoA desaturase [Lobosporangium transversale]|uniref:Acyl-CoA desaturase n=1 Tax=Lobosporangium transversale TaxID=64571 RepID=A0A1Y2GVN6_9FUNG|nr:putative stearoyl-CoA desaturase [Lobosporangium transversale]ORZ26360.1 putative stearoyl-CoA desaturase [Lobosporangium transversale]|eukprot:XP_021884125.1 putative stearoyl-CoA desaturase [Lobosporangium transversale]
MSSITEATKRTTRTAFMKDTNSEMESVTEATTTTKIPRSRIDFSDKANTIKHIEEIPKINTKADFSVLYEPWSIHNFYKKIDWVHVLPLIFMPIYGFYTALTSVPLQQKTAIFAVGYFVFTGLGITAGYHRLWSHRSYAASPLLQFTLMIASTGAMQGSILWWCRNHRAHHRYTDTDKDPYGVKKGLIWSHIIWMLIYQDPAAVGWADISDLKADKLVMFQHNHFPWLAPMISLGVPTVVAGLGWGDYWGGFIYGGIIRQFIVHQSTFCVNSLAHWLGDMPFDDRRTPRDHLFTALLTLGEGYHNFHHEFPQDYRNAIKIYQYDPTKWLIAFCSFIGLARDLKRFPSNEIKKGQLKMQQKKLDKVKSTLIWGTPIDQLPIFSFDEFHDMANKEGRAVTLIEGIIYDISSFIDEHPGGRSLIRSAIGKDATTSFNGGVYDHSSAARHLLERMRVGVVAGGGYVEHRCKGTIISHALKQ